MALQFAPITFKDLQVSALGKARASMRANAWGSAVARWLNEAHKIMVAKGDGVQDYAEFVTVNGQNRYPLPPGWISFFEVEFNGMPILPMRLSEMDHYSNWTSAGAPPPPPPENSPDWNIQYQLGTTDAIDRYVVWGGEMELGPLPPSGEYPVSMYYYRQAGMMVEDDDEPEVPDQFRPYLTSYAGAYIALADKDNQTAQMLMQDFQGGCQLFEQYQTFGARDSYPQTDMVVDYR